MFTGDQPQYGWNCRSRAKQKPSPDSKRVNDRAKISILTPSHGASTSLTPHYKGAQKKGPHESVHTEQTIFYSNFLRMNYSNGLSHLQGKLLKTTLVWMKCPTQVCEVRTCIRMSGLITVPIHRRLPHPWIPGVLDPWPWKQMILLALIITQSTNPSSSSACSAHPVDTCSWCTMLQRWGFFCSHGFCKEANIN